MEILIYLPVELFQKELDKEQVENNENPYWINIISKYWKRNFKSTANMPL